MTVDMFGCMGASSRAYSGVYVDLINPDPKTICLEDIATGLSNLCRFTGQIRPFYSVAEHSVLVLREAMFCVQTDKEFRKALLLHDAAEAYINDISKPLKNRLPDYQAVEARFEDVISERFGVKLKEFHDEVKLYDRILLMAEKNHFRKDGVSWVGERSVPKANVDIKCWVPDAARHEFLKEAFNLGIA